MITIGKKYSFLALAMGACLASQTVLACKIPATPVSLPDGRSADVQEMQHAKQQVEQYLDRVSEYFACEKDALKLQEVSEQQKFVISRFNTELRAFRAASRAASARAVSYNQR